MRVSGQDLDLDDPGDRNGQIWLCHKATLAQLTALTEPHSSSSCRCIIRSVFDHIESRRGQYAFVSRSQQASPHFAGERTSNSNVIFALHLLQEIENIGKCQVQELEFELDLAALLGKFSLEGLDFVGRL